MDFFGKPVNFRIDGATTFKTSCGAGCSLAIIIVVFLYALNKFQAMVERSDLVLTSQVLPDQIPISEEFTFSETNL